MRKREQERELDLELAGRFQRFDQLASLNTSSQFHQRWNRERDKQGKRKSRRRDEDEQRCEEQRPIERDASFSANSNRECSLP